MKSEKSYLWENSKPTYGDGRIPNSKDLPKTITEAMSLYIVRKETALKNRKRFGNRPYFLFGEPLEYIDINNPEDLAAAEVIAEGYKNKEVNRLRLLRNLCTKGGWYAIISTLPKSMTMKIKAPTFADLFAETSPQLGGARRKEPLHKRWVICYN